MNKSPRLWIPLVVAIGFAAAPFGNATAQVECCPTTSVVAYQPVAAPVVTPIDPNLITGWYPGKLLDRWAANRAAYRATATTTAVTAAYRPVATAVPVTSYRPTSLLSTSYMPVSVYRPVIAQPVVATTAYSPVTATTAYSPVVSSSALCCDPCSTGTVASYPATTSACCGVTAPATSYGGAATPVPALRADEPITNSGAYQQQSQRPPTGTDGNYGSSGEKSVTGPQQQDDATGGAQEQDSQQQGTQQDGTGPASFEGPFFRRPDRPADDGSPDPVARTRRTEAVAAVYTTPVRPQLVRETRSSTPSRNSGAMSLPSRAERDAGWEAVD